MQQLVIDTILLPTLDNIIFLDIETARFDDVNRSVEEIWLIGCMTNNEITQFSQDHRSEFQDFLVNFTQFLENHQDQAIVCYSKTYFVIRILLNTAYRYRLPALLKELTTRPWIDLGSLFSSHNVSEGSLALKELGSRLGYNFQEKIKGYQLSLSYEKLHGIFEAVPEDFMHVALRYNRDDLLSMQFLIEHDEIPTKFHPLSTINFSDKLAEFRKMIFRVYITHKQIEILLHKNIDRPPQELGRCDDIYN